MSARRILMGVIGRPHGVRGLVHVQSYTADPADLATYAPLLDEAGRTWTLAWRTPGIAELRGPDNKPIPDRTAAERLTNTRLYIDRDRLPPAGEDEFYLSDLVGLRAEDPQGAELGRVAIVHDYGAGPSLEIARAGQPLLIPFTRACVPEIDVQAGKLTVIPPQETTAP